MNANRLTKYLDGRLSPDDRISLIAAAHLRKDFAEKERLGRGEPRRTWHLPETYPLSEAWYAVAQIEFMEVTQTILALRETQEFFRYDDISDEFRLKLADSFDVLLYSLLLRVRAWRRLGKRLGINSLAFWYKLPGWEEARRAIVFARKSAPKRAAVERILGERMPGVDAIRVVTIGNHLARLRREFQAMLARWKTSDDGPPVSEAFRS